MLRQESGSLLLFLPGVGEIHACRNNWLRASAVMCCSARCRRVVAERSAKSDPSGTARNAKVVLATNIAETSLTIEGIRLWWIVLRKGWRALIRARDLRADYSTR